MAAKAVSLPAPIRGCRPPLSLSLLLPLLIVTAGARADNDLNWVSQEQMSALPAEQQKPIPVWCGGTYHNPAVGMPVEGSDTVVTADRSSLVQNEMAELYGDVRIEQPGRRIFTEAARMDQATGTFYVDSPLRLETHEGTFLAASMSGQTRQQLGTLDEVEYALFANHARGNAEHVDIQGNQAKITRGSYTTCAPGNNGWLLSGGRIRLDQDSGWGQASNVVLRVKGMPIIWLPWITFPIDDTRKTGLLFPSLSIGDGGGLDFSQPVYLNLHPQMDATIAPRYVDERGSGVDNEFRYLTRYGRGGISYGIIFSDRQFDDQNREVARWTHSGNINRWQLTTDVNYVSDDFYFKDLDTGLEIRSRTHLPLLAQARYYGRTWQALARLQSWQTIDPTLAERNLPYRRLPQLQLSGRPTLYGPLQALWLSDFTYFDRSDSENTINPVGGRLHLAPALNLRLSKPWGYLEPRVRAYHNQYQLENAGIDDDKTPSLNTWGSSIDSGLFFDRDFQLFGADYTQTLEPRLFLNYVDYTEQDQLPNFDAGELTFSYTTLFRENRFIGYDRIGDEQKASLGVTSRFLRNNDGREQLRLRAGQGYFFADRKINVNRTEQELSAKQTPIVGDAQWNFGQHWHLYSEGQWDPETEQRQRTSVRVGYNDRERRVFNLGYTDRPTDMIRESELSTIWPVHPNWRLIGRWIFDLENHRTLESVAGAEFRNCCWQIRMLNQRELTDLTGDGQLEPDNTFWVQIQMLGLGGFGGRMEQFLQRSIRGYRSYE